MTRIQPTGPGVPSTPASSAEEKRLRKAASQLEGVFVEQLFKAMRETVPSDGITSGGAGEEVFSGLLDQHLAEAVPSQLNDGLGEALYRQLRAQLPPKGAAATETIGGLNAAPPALPASTIGTISDGHERTS